MLISTFQKTSFVYINSPWDDRLMKSSFQFHHFFHKNTFMIIYVFSL